MSTEQKPEAKKRRGTSIPLLIAFLVLGVGGYYAGPSIMTYVFLLQEKMIAESQDGGKRIPTPTKESNPISKAVPEGSEGSTNTASPATESAPVDPPGADDAAGN